MSITSLKQRALSLISLLALLSALLLGLAKFEAGQHSINSPWSIHSTNHTINAVNPNARSHHF
ncbi:MAG: hypothetical protein M3Z24_14910 [Chloroflexota bacterium]|nr:hypothetical protein [Chloroflexota bacterium]